MSNRVGRTHRTRGIAPIFLVSLVGLGIGGGGCSSSSSSDTPLQSAASTEAATVSTNATTPSVKRVNTAGKFSREDFQVANFDENSINITNKYFPLIPGTRHEYDGSTVEEGKTLSHRVTFTVTNLTKKINGVNTVVIWESDFTEGELDEDELTFFAQDKLGNVWHLGQYSELWEAGEYTAGRTWFVGHPEDAKAGIMMKADPKANTPDWSEGFAPPPYFWSDRARVRSSTEKTVVPTGTYEGVLVTEEYNEEETSAIQLKYYAPGIGVVRVGWDGTDESKETLLMVHTEELSPAKLDAASKGALELEKRALVFATADPSVQRT